MTKHNSEHKLWAFGVSLLLGLAGASLTACNNSQQENTASGLMGRLTSVSDTKVVVEVFDRPSNAASGAAVDGSRGDKKPEGTPPADFKQGEKPDGTPPADFKQGEKPEGERPDGTPPADRPDMKQDDQKEGRPDSENGRKQMKGESRTFGLTEDTKIYKQEGEEQTEISADELELGSMLSVVADGDTAETITVQSGENWQKRGDS